MHNDEDDASTHAAHTMRARQRGRTKKTTSRIQERMYSTYPSAIPPTQLSSS